MTDTAITGQLVTVLMSKSSQATEMLFTLQASKQAGWLVGWLKVACSFVLCISHREIAGEGV